MRKEEFGATMIEMIGVIGIIGVVSAGAWRLMASGWSRYRLSQGASQLQSLQKAVVRKFAAAGNYNNLKSDTIAKELDDNKALPPQMYFGTGEFHHAFGGDVEIKPVAYSDVSEYGEAKDSFTITFKNLNFQQCAEMASISWLGNDFANLVSIKVGTTKFVWPTYKEATGNFLPLTRAKAGEVCADAPKDITWEFR